MLRRYAKRALKRLATNDFQALNHIELNARAIVHNVELIQRRHPGFSIIPVLKGNAYGHGLAEVAGLLNQADCRYLAVDGYFEAAGIRDITKHHILVMGHILPENARLLDTRRCSFVVQDIHGLTGFGVLGKPVKVHLELNTGFNRLGLRPEELTDYLETFKRYPNLELEGVMTHLVDADNEADESFDTRQQQLFDKTVGQILEAGFQPKLLHIAQTAGSAKIQSRYANAIRLGIGTYGINPLAPADPHHPDLAGLQPVLELKSTIVKVIELRQGDTVGYNATYTAPRPMRIGVLPLGYYEGVPRSLSNQGCATSGDDELPIVGRVCMNHTVIDLGKTGLQAGAEVTLISNDPLRPNSVAGLAVQHGLFPYTTLTGLSGSVRRRVV